MQITEQIIQRIARQVFNQMFPSSLRQSGAVISGAGSSVQYAAEAGHAASADSASYASTAGSANSVAWANVSSKPDTATRWPAWSEVTEKPTSFTPPLAADGTRGGIQIGFTTSANDRNYAVQLSNEKAYVNVPWTDHYAWSDITDKPATATRWPTWSEVTSKPTSKTAWGQTYLDGDSAFQNISGNMTNVGDISFAATGKNIGSIAYFDTTNSRLGIGTSSPSDKLHVAGLVKITNNGRTLTIGAQNASAIHIYNDNNSTTFVNGGFSSSGDTSYDLGSASYRWGTIYGNRLIAYSTTDAEAGAANAVALITGAPQGYHLEMDGNEIMAKSDGTHASTLYLNADGGNVILCESSGSVGIGTSSPSYKLHVVGAIYCTSGFTFLSDINKKDVITYQWAPALSAIAEAPIIRYTLKDDKEKRERIGSVAQYWQQITPEAVTEAHDGTLSMDYGSIALTSVIALAREVKQLKAQIARLTQQRNG